MAFAFVAGFALGAVFTLAVILGICDVGSYYDDPLMHLLDPVEEARDGR